MSIIAKKSEKQFETHPSGLFLAVCCDVVDLGDVEVTFNGKTKKQHKVRAVWQTEEKRGDGKSFLISKRYTLSLDEKATLRKDLTSWRGKPFTEAELEGFDLEVLVGVNCQLSVVQVERNGQMYADIATVVPPPKGMPKIHAVEYVRVKDRTDEEAPAPTDDDDSSGVPF